MTDVQFCDQHWANYKKWYSSNGTTLEHYDRSFELMKAHLSSCDVPLTEIENHWADYCNEKALLFLKRLREGNSHAGLLVRYLREVLKAGAVDFDDIGTSADEIKHLEVVGFKLLAPELLAPLRAGKCSFHYLTVSDAHRLRDQLSRLGISPEDVGSSKAEIASFVDTAAAKRQVIANAA